AGGGNPGTPGAGTIFKIDAAGVFTVLHSFNWADGSAPCARLTQGSDDSFYGTTTGGGPDCAGSTTGGTVFKMDGSGAVTTLHTFTGGDGSAPYGGLIQGRDGSLYGTTAFGGAAATGTIFKIDPAGTFTTVHSFAYGEGINPYAGLIQGNDGSFYGTTRR